MGIYETGITGLLILKPEIWKDERGYFFETYQAKRYHENGVHTTFVQDNEAYSQKGVLRGLHYQLPPFAQSKLVRVVKGAALDVAVDIRPTSPTFGQYESVILDDQEKLQFYIPEGFAHGYLCLTEEVIFAYKCNQYYSKSSEGGIIYNDSTLNIDWQFNLNEVIVSPKDLLLPPFGQHLCWPF